MIPAERALLRRLGFLAAVVALLFTVGTGAFLLLGHGLADAVFLAGGALTTSGFLIAEPLDGAERVLLVALSIFGVTVFLAILASLGSAMSDVEFRWARRRRRMQAKIDGMRDHFVVCAYGRVGRAVARELEADGVPFVVVDSKADLEPRMASDGVRYLVGDPSAELILRQAGVDRARALVCAVDDDAVNVYITLGARALNPDLFIVGRASDSLAAERLHRAGADRVVSPYVESGRHMALMALRPGVHDFLDVVARGGDRTRVNEVVVDESNGLDGASVGDAAGGAVALLVRRADGEVVFHPSREDVLHAGDVLLSFGQLEANPARGSSS